MIIPGIFVRSAARDLIPYIKISMKYRVSRFFHYELPAAFCIKRIHGVEASGLYGNRKYHYQEDESTMIVRSLFPILALIGCCALIGAAFAASDCGCGGLPSSSPPSGWADAGNAAMNSYSGFGSSTGGTGSGSSTGGTGTSSPSSDYGSSSGSGSGTGGSSSGIGGSSGSLSGSNSDEAVKMTSQAIALFKEGDYNNSLAALNGSINLDPYSAKTWITKGDVLSAMGLLNESIAAYTQVIHLDPSDPAVYAKMGDVLVKMGAYKEAVASYDHALTLEPGYPSIEANRTQAAEFASGLIAESNTSGSTPASSSTPPPATLVPADTAAQPTIAVTVTKAPLPGVLVLPAFCIIGIFLLNKKRKHQ
jgi:tetratricopeptide (TPR) repeat protein